MIASDVVCLIHHLPVVFTEHAPLMAANTLNSPRAVAVSVHASQLSFSVSAFVVVHDVTLREILHKLRPLLEPPPQPPKPEIGFHVKEDTVRYRVRKKN